MTERTCRHGYLVYEHCPECEGTMTDMKRTPEISGMDRLTDEAPLSERLRAHCIGQPAIVAWPHRILHEAALVAKAVEDVAHGRGMFGVDAKADLEWALGVLADALAHRRTSQEG